MALFQLDPPSIVARVQASGGAAHLPTLSESLLRGTLGFAVVSVAGFAPWPIIGTWFHSVSETAMFACCTAVFIALSGLCLHRLVIGPGSLSRFYRLFALAFAGYAIGWIAMWKLLHGDAGGIGGLFVGTAVMGAILAVAFDAWRAVPKIVAALFVLNALGYRAGAWVEGKLAFDHRVAAMLLWGVCYGLGFGAGLGLAFYFCQERVREALRAA